MTYQRCTRCVMDNASDDTITFDAHGHCSYCTQALEEAKTTYFPNEEGRRKLEAALSAIKEHGKGRKYDCMMGISGGLDSAYLAMLGHKWGLRILAVHIDDGFDTPTSKANIKQLCEAANIELRVITPPPSQYNDLTRAYMEAGVPNLAVPQDNILFAFLYDTMKREKIKYFLNGGNFALESILQQGNTHNALDVTNIRDIHRRFGHEPIDGLKFTTSYEKYILMKKGYSVQLRLLNYIDYNRKRAIDELHEFCGFEYYGRKHLENILTAFLQLCWLPRKFGVDKRTSHLSSMIISGQMTRDEALHELEEPVCDEAMMNEYIAVIKKGLGLSNSEFERLMSAPAHQHTDYKTDWAGPLIRRIFFRR